VVQEVGVGEQAEGDVGGAACDVEDGLGVRGGAGVEGAGEAVFPEAVDAEGHEVVHGVVGGGDGGEDGGDWRAMLTTVENGSARAEKPLEAF